MAELTTRMTRTRDEKAAIAAEIEALNKERLEITDKIDLLSTQHDSVQSKFPI